MIRRNAICRVCLAQLRQDDRHQDGIEQLYAYTLMQGITALRGPAAPRPERSRFQFSVSSIAVVNGPLVIIRAHPSSLTRKASNCKLDAQAVDGF